MGLLDWLRGAPRVETKLWSEDFPVADASPELVDAIKWGALGGYGAIYRAQPAVYTVVEFLAWQVSQVGIKVYRRSSDTDREQLRDSPIARLLNNPAEGLTYERFLHATVADLGIWGNAYWLKLGKGDARALVPLPPYAMTPQGGTFHQASEYRFDLNEVRKTYGAEQIVHFRRYNPNDLRVGISPLEPLRRILVEETEASADRIGFWRNSARVGGVIERPVDQPWNDDSFKRFISGWASAHTGAANSGGTAVLEDGMTYKPASWSPKDAEFIEGRKLTLETVARAFNIPLSVLGLTQTATFASQREFHKALYQDTLGPWLKMLQGEIEDGVVSWMTNDPDVYVEFNLEEKLRGSFEEQADAARAYGGVPIMTVNELRARHNLPRIDDPAFDTPVMPANIVYAGMPEPMEEPPKLRVASAEPETKVAE